MEQTKLNKILDFLAEMRKEVSPAAYFHLGDLLFRIYLPSNRFDSNKDLQVWEEDGRIIGLCFYLTGDANPEYMIRPYLFDSSLPKEMVQWSIIRSKELGQNTIETGCIDGDLAKSKFLRSFGFKPCDENMVFMTLSMEEALLACELPKDYSLVTAKDRPDLPILSGDLWTKEEYRTFCSVPEYQNALGQRVCYRDREIVAGCLIWYDPRDNTGLFEPVDTLEAHRRKGLAQAAMAQALENLRTLGAKTCYVKTHADNVPAIRLYEKLGFKISHVDQGWSFSC